MDTRRVTATKMRSEKKPGSKSDTERRWVASGNLFKN
jgi:hypothetical protein